MCQKAEELAQTMGKESSVQLMDGLTVGIAREYYVQACAWCRTTC
jgi:hypothetical protein